VLQARWERADRFQEEVRGRVVGLWGYGGIGRETARLAHLDSPLDQREQHLAVAHSGEARSADVPSPVRKRTNLLSGFCPDRAPPRTGRLPRPRHKLPPGKNLPGQWLWGGESGSGGIVLAKRNRERRSRRSDGYRPVPHPEEGDLAAFRDAGGAIAHTGVVRLADADGLVLIESKWGSLGRYVHTATDHPYRRCTITYYRRPRQPLDAGPW
jgi:hypothetical protein